LYGKSVALNLWQKHELSVPVDLRRLTTELGLDVVAFPFGGRVKEAIIDRTIGIQPGLLRPWFRWYVAHAIYTIKCNRMSVERVLG